MASENASRLMLSDWAATGDAIPKHRQRLLEELLLLSLIYDELLIQDEVLVLNVSIAEQFTTPERFRVIEQLIETGALVILTHPLPLYPDIDIRERAFVAPVKTRAEYIAKFGTSGDRFFIPTAKQIQFYDLLDGCIQKHPQSHKPVSSETFDGRDVMEVFALLLRLVLKDHENYGKWLRSAFRGISGDMRTEFIRCIESPNKAFERIRHHRGEVKAVPRKEGTPVFNRSLGYQLSATFSPQEALSMQHLIQTIFAAPFCFREKAIGRYSKYLREFLMIPSTVDTPLAPSTNHVSVIADVATDLHLPSTDQRFCDTVQAVRSGQAGRKLRNAMRRIGSDREFVQVETCLQAVAEELARHYYSNNPVEIRSVLCTFGESLASATIARTGEACFYAQSITSLSAAISPIVWEVLGRGILLGGSLVLESLKHDLKYQQLRRKIETALRVRCSDISIPQALVGY